MKDYQVALNFVAIENQMFSFDVWCKPYEETTKEEHSGKQIRRYRLSSFQGTVRESQDVWVSFEPIDGFLQRTLTASASIGLTKHYCYRCLVAAAKAGLKSGEYDIEEQHFRPSVDLILETFPEGKQCVWIEPYYLGAHKLFGFLVDFRFKKTDGMEFNRRVQQLSLSLNSRYQANKDFYYDRRAKIEIFFGRYWHKIFPIGPKQTPITAAPKLSLLAASTLETKSYVFANHQVANSQFMGLTRFGPFEKTKGAARFFFIYTTQNRDLARSLFSALRGDSPDFSFKGIEKTFGLPFSSKNVEGLEITSLSDKTAIATICDKIKNHGEELRLPIIILPEDRDEDTYFLLKSCFNEVGLSFQGVSVALLTNKESLKWSVANIALQIFAKAGGVPWVVDSKTSDTLILGIGKSHLIVEENGKRRVTKFFSFSVLTEANGLYKDLRVLGRSDDEQSYLSELSANLEKTLRESQKGYSQIVLHTPFKIRDDELGAIEDVVARVAADASSGTTFAVIKINHENKFWGYHPAVNSLIPYESTLVRIGFGEYLVWFEGLQYHSPNVQKRIGGPTHVDFVFPRSGVTAEKEMEHLQVLINLSGANWRGFNAKAMPVSTYYCKIVADFVKEFDLRELPEASYQSFKPWFI